MICLQSLVCPGCPVSFQYVLNCGSPELWIFLPSLKFRNGLCDIYLYSLLRSLNAVAAWRAVAMAVSILWIGRQCWHAGNVNQ